MFSVRMRMFASISLALLLLSGAGCSAQKEDSVPQEKNTELCGWVGDEPVTAVPDLAQRSAGYVDAELSPDISMLNSTQTKVLEKLVDASKIMNQLYHIQATPCREALQERIAALPASEQAAAERYFQINAGPWDRRFHYKPFMGSWEHPEGANYYPLDLTEEEIAFIGDTSNGLDGLFTMIRRDESGALKAIPYSEIFAGPLQDAASLLREAAALTENASLKAFLNSRATAFLTDDYYESDMLWMDLDGLVEITIGPYETYEDGLFGYKAAFESFVTVTDPEESQRLAKFKDELPWLEAHLPIPEADKNLNRGSDSPIRVVDEVYSAGDTRAGVQTIAFNLPNDERVREAKGSKKVLLRNIMKSKFDRILMPIARELVSEDQLSLLTAESFFLHTLWHEMSHGLGPGKIVLDGRETEVRLELKETYSTLEEAKADAMGEWDIFALVADGRDYFSPNIRNEQAATYLAGLFRSVRFGIGEAHGQANAIQFNYLMEKKAISHNPDTGRFSVNVDVFEKVIEEMVAEICVIQARGDYAASVKFIDQYGGMVPVLEEALAKLDAIPVDLKPVFSRYE